VVRVFRRDVGTAAFRFASPAFDRNGNENETGATTTASFIGFPIGKPSGGAVRGETHAAPASWRSIEDRSAMRFAATDESASTEPRARTHAALRRERIFGVRPFSSTTKKTRARYAGKKAETDLAVVFLYRGNNTELCTRREREEMGFDFGSNDDGWHDRAERAQEPENLAVLPPGFPVETERSFVSQEGFATRNDQFRIGTEQRVLKVYVINTTKSGV